MAKNRDYSFVANNHDNGKKKATNINAQEEILLEVCLRQENNCVLMLVSLKWSVRGSIIIKLVFPK